MDDKELEAFVQELVAKGESPDVINSVIDQWDNEHVAGPPMPAAAMLPNAPMSQPGVADPTAPRPNVFTQEPALSMKQGVEGGLTGIGNLVKGGVMTAVDAFMGGGRPTPRMLMDTAMSHQKAMETHPMVGAIPGVGPALVSAGENLGSGEPERMGEGAIEALALVLGGRQAGRQMPLRPAIGDAAARTTRVFDNNPELSTDFSILGTNLPKAVEGTARIVNRQINPKAPPAAPPPPPAPKAAEEPRRGSPNKDQPPTPKVDPLVARMAAGNADAQASSRMVSALRPEVPSAKTMNVDALKGAPTPEFAANLEASNRLKHGMAQGQPKVTSAESMDVAAMGKPGTHANIKASKRMIEGMAPFGKRPKSPTTMDMGALNDAARVSGDTANVANTKAKNSMIAGMSKAATPSEADAALAAELKKRVKPKVEKTPKEANRDMFTFNDVVPIDAMKTKGIHNPGESTQMVVTDAVESARAVPGIPQTVLDKLIAASQRLTISGITPRSMKTPKPKPAPKPKKTK